MMKSASVKGRFSHQHCSNKSHKRNTGQTKTTLLFKESKKALSSQPKPCIFSALLQETDVDLGSIDQNWFEKALGHEIVNSPATPGLNPVTPNLAPEKLNPATWTPARLDATPSSQGVDPTQEEPGLGGWFPVHRQTTPTFMKQLFKTPSTVSNLEDISFATPGRFLSTPLRMSLSLGADLDDSNLSWTSSLATPRRSMKKTNVLRTTSNIDGQLESTVVAKALFTSATKLPEELTGPDSVSSTFPLCSLRRGNDVHRRLLCYLPDECTRGSIDDAAAVMSRGTILADEESQSSQGNDIANGAQGLDAEKAEQDCSAHHVQTSKSNGLTINPKGTEVDMQEECLSLPLSSKPQDNVDQRDNSPAWLPKTVLTEDNHNIVSAVVTRISSQVPTCDEPKESLQRDSQKSLENLTANEASDKSGLEHSRMEDTLAFLFLTPPQTRRRLAKLKTQHLAKDRPLLPDSSCDGKREANAESPSVTSHEECKNSQMSQRTADVVNEVMNREDSSPTKRHTSVITMKDVDGSLKEYVEDLSELSAGVNFTNPGVGQTLSSVPEAEDSEMCVKLLNTHSPKSSLSKKALLPTLPVQYIADITPIRQTQMFVSPPNVNSPDVFSQISPNFAEALCSITDQVSESHLTQSVLPPVPEENDQSSSNKLPPQNHCNKTPLSRKSPPLPEQHDSIALPLSINPNCGMHQTTVSESEQGQQNVPKSCCNQETPSQLFRMQPKAATSRKFFYPSASSAAPKTNKPMQWVANVVLVKEKEKQQASQETVPEQRQEKSSTGKTISEALASTGAGTNIYSSTPAPRNSAFVTFTNFIKSERSSSATPNPTRLTPIDPTPAQAQTPFFASHQQAPQALSINVDSRFDSSTVSNETTPVSRRTVVPRSRTIYCGVRRKAGAYGLPAPKRLKTAMEGNTEQNQTEETLISLKSSVEEQRIPDSVCFESASGKAIQISDSALKKAAALLDETDGEQSVPPGVALPDPTKDEPPVEQGTHVPQSSTKRDKDPDCAQRVVAIDSVPASSGAVSDVNVTLTVADMKSTRMSESISKAAKPCLKDERGDARTGQNQLLAEIERSDNYYSSQHQDVKLEKVDRGITNSIPNIVSGRGVQRALECEQVPSFSGFASASGKTIAIPNSALQKAQKMLDDAESEIQPTVGFAPAGGRPMQISELELKKARALLDDSEETSLPTSRAQPHLRTAQKQNKKLSKTSAVLGSQNIVQPQLPKGFRPFKAPARVNPTARQKTAVITTTQQVECMESSLNVESRTNEQTTPLAPSPKHLQSIPESHILDLPLEPQKEKALTVAEDIEFEEFQSASQTLREIEAAEEMESAYAFMQAENDSFSQLEELTIKKLDHSNCIKHSSCPVENENSVAAEQYDKEPEKQKSEYIADEQHASGLSDLHSLPPSQVSSQVSSTLDKAFVQSRRLEIWDKEIGNQADNRQEDIIKSENQYECDVTAPVPGNTAINTVQSLPISNCSFVGFQTASGTKVTLSQGALQKAKMLLDTVNHTENDTRLEPKRTCRKRGKDDDQHTDSTADQIASGFQTAGGTTLLVYPESFDRAKMLLSDTSEQFVQRAKNGDTPPDSCSQSNVKSASVEDGKGKSTFSTRMDHQMTAHVTKTLSGFQTAGGRSVSISDEALKRARNLFVEEVTNSRLQTANEPDENLQQITADVDMDQRDGAVYDRGQTIESTGSCSDVSPTRPTRGSELRIHTIKAAGDAQPSGFTTASGKKLAISHESLQQAKMFLDKPQDDFAAEEIASKTPQTVGRGPLFHGFSTASGNKVSVSEAALQRAKKVLQDSSDGLEVSVSFGNESSSPDCKRRRIDREPDVAVPIGFRTTSGTKVSISEVSLQKAKDLLDESSECSTSAPKSSSGFQTASGNKVSVSAKSLGNAQRLLADAESAPVHVPSCVKMPAMGFSTAGGAQVAVSEAALKSARRLFQESDDNSQVSALDHSGSSQAVADQAFSKAHPHAGGDNTDAVVPSFGGNTSTKISQNLRTKVSVNMPGFHHRSLANKQMTSSTKQRSLVPFPRHRRVTSPQPLTAFQPPFQTAQSQSTQSRPRPGRAHGGQQVVPATVIPLLPPKLGAPLLGDIGQEGAQPNKRTLSVDGPQACGPVPKRARLEAVPLLDEKTTNHFSSEEHETSLLAGVWEQARRKQASRIQGKKTQVIKPQPGKLFTKRLHEPRLPLWELVNGQPPQQYSSHELVDSGILPSTLAVTSSTAEAFIFSLRDHYSLEALDTSEGLMLGDEGRLVPGDAGLAGKEEFFNALLDMPGVDPKLLTSDWINNHYRWIVWKLASLERAYPGHLAARLLTPDWVLLQLKYRYDREVDHAQRSALKKILERDDAPSRRMVLCVAGIHLAETCTGAVANQEGTDGKDNERIASPPAPTLELTDGWYSIRTVIDKPLAGLVHAGKIHIGQKLCIYGAELVGSQDACLPLEVPANLRLRISANATRRARYDARLGLQRRPQPYPLSLASLYPQGGPVGCVDVVVVRTYPVQFMEKLSEGGCIFRGRRAEEKEAARFAQEKQRRMEQLYNQIHEEYQEKETKKANPNRRSSSAQKLTANEVGQLQTGQELYEALNTAMDPGAIQALLSETQMLQLDDYQRSLHEKKQAALQGQFKRAMEDKEQERQIQRNVTPLLRLRVADYLSKPGSRSDTYQLTVWRPTDDVMQLLSEGKRLKVFNLSASVGRFCLGSSAVQLASIRATRYQIMPLSNPSGSGWALYQPREVLKFTDALRAGYQPAYGEVDVVGVVVTVQGAAISPGNSQIVYLADAEGNFISIKFWGGLQAHSMENLVQSGILIATANLQWRSNSTSPAVPCLHVKDSTSVTQSPKAEHLRAALQDLHNHIKNPKAFSQSMEPFAMEMIHKPLRHSVPTTPRPENSPFGMAPWSDSRPVRGSTMPSATPEMGKLSFPGNAPSLNPNQQSLPSPVLESSANHLGPYSASTPLLPIATRILGGRTLLGEVSTPVMTPHDKRKLDVSRRYDLLSRVPSPPALSPLPTPLTNRVMRSFRLPSSRRSLPRQGLSYRSNLHNAPGLKVQEPEVRLDNPCTSGRGTVESVQSSENLNPAAFASPAKDIERRIDANCKPENCPEEDMTPSQRQIQEVLGMSYQSLREIDLEWTQQMDPIADAWCSQPSPDFSCDTPSQSPPVKEEVSSAPMSKSPANLNQVGGNDTVLVGDKLMVMSRVDKNEVQSKKPLTSKKVLSRQSRREVACRGTPALTAGASDLQNLPRVQKVMSTTEDQKAPGCERENLGNKQQAPVEMEMDGRLGDVDEVKNLVQDEPQACGDAVEVDERDVQQDKHAWCDDTAAVQEVPPKQVSGQKKRQSRSRADLSILEASILLGGELGEPTRRLTRSASRRATVEK